MSNSYLSKNDMLNVLNGHLTELNAEQYSHRLRIIEFDAAGAENINSDMYNQISQMIAQYDLRIQALESEKERVLALPE